jgi:hypothetical protein
MPVCYVNKKRFLIRVFAGIWVIVILVSCQRELNPDPLPVSKGNLLKDSDGNCASVSVSGIYSIDQNFNDSNYLVADVNVTLAGSYEITTDTINGYSFKANGVFVNNGLVHVKLSASGKPVAAGRDQFTLQYNGSFCEAKVDVIDSTLKPAVFSLEGAPGNCMNDTVYGSYIKSIVLDTGAIIKVMVNVSSTGIYNINTNTVNGYAFSASGIFSATGLHSVTLIASGTPVNAGTDAFTINTGTSSCSFSINVLTTTNILGNDYYPLSVKSYWIYDDLVNTGDTIKETIIDSTNINSNLYKTINEDVHFGGPYQYFYRKNNSVYYEYAAPNKYTTFFQYKKPVYADIPFLKENISTADTWQSPEYIDTSSNGDIIYLKYEFTCLNGNAAITINDKAFINVYEIKMLPLIKTSGDDYVYTSEEYLFYYAKGIGLIYLKKTLSGFIQKEMQIRNWQVY